MINNLTAQNVIEKALADKIALLTDAASETFYNLCSEYNRNCNRSDYDTQTADNLEVLFSICGNLAVAIKKYPSGSNSAKILAAHYEREWNDFSQGHDLIKPLAAYFGDDKGTALTAQLKDLLAAGFAVMRGDAMAVTLDQPPRPALPKATTFHALLSQTL